MFNVLLFLVLFALSFYVGFVCFRAVTLLPLGNSFPRAVWRTIARDIYYITGRV